MFISCRLGLLASVILLGTLPRLVAGTFTWTNLVSGNASGSWGTQVNWSGGILPTTTNDLADFSALNITANSTVTLDGDRNINALIFGDTATGSAAGWNLNAGTSAGSTLILGGNAPTITVNGLGGTSQVNIGATIAGSQGFTKQGAGKLNVSGTNLLAGQLAVGAGTFLTGYSFSQTVTNSLFVSAGASYQENSSGAVVTLNGAISGQGAVKIFTLSGQTVFGGDNSAFQGAMQLFRGAKLANSLGLGGPSTTVTLSSGYGGYLDLNGLNVSNVNVTFNTSKAGVLFRFLNSSATPATFAGDINISTIGSVDGSGDITLSGTISDSGSSGLTKTGAGTLTLRGTNTYSGPTLVNGGSLVVNGDNFSAPGNVVVASGATLGGSGSIGGSVTFTSGAMATNTLGAPLAIIGSLTNSNNSFNVYVPGNEALRVGNYSLMTYGGVLSGSFNVIPVISGAGIELNTLASIKAGNGVVSLVIKSNIPCQYLLLNRNAKDGASSNLVAYVQQKFGTANQASALKVGISVIYLAGLNAPKFLAILTNDLACAQRMNVPILIQVDTEDFLPNSLLNWYDPTSSGFDPAKVTDVEWFGLDANTAVKLCWRNWGGLMRVGPRPNWLSVNYQAFEKDIYTNFIPVVTQWYNNLSQTQRWIFVGWKCGWESSLNTGYIYYINGNSFYGTTNNPLPTDSKQALGYNAFQSANLGANRSLTANDMSQIAGMHLSYLASLAFSNGIPKSKIFIHGVSSSNYQENMSALVNPFANPGTSWYGNPSNPLKSNVNFIQSVCSAENNFGASGYCYGEFNLFTTDYSKWFNWFNVALRGDPHCRYQSLFNYESMQGVSSVEQAMLDVMALYPAGSQMFQWTNLIAGSASGSWTNKTNWLGLNATLPTMVNDTVDFSTIDVTEDCTVTLDGDQSINALIFGDTATNTAARWTLDPGTPPRSTLLLGGLSPSITVNSLGGDRSVNILATIVGTQGFRMQGTGTLSLAGTNSYSGTTTLDGGKLVGIAGGSCDNSDFRLTSGTTIGIKLTTANGQWSCAGLTCNTGAGYADFDIGGLTLSTSIAPMRINGNLVVNGTLQVIVRNTGSLGLGVYPLMTWKVTGPTNLANFEPPLLPEGVVGRLSLSSNTLLLHITGTAQPAPTNITYTISDHQLVLDWPTDQGWQLQMQTNTTQAGLGTNWFTMPLATPPWTNIINPTNQSVFYRLVF